MKMHRLLRVLGLVLLGITSYMVSFYIVNAGQKSVRRQVQAPADSAKPMDVNLDDFAPRLGADEMVMPLNHAEISTNRVTITTLRPAQGGVIVDATANLARSNYDRSFVWSLATKRKGSSTQGIEKFYTHQPGISPRGAQLQPTFREHVILPSGQLVVSLRLYEVPPGGVDLLKDQETAMTYILASDTRDILIP